MAAKGAVVGVLALQGSFAEHCTALKRLSVNAAEVRTAEELDACDGLIIPGGESTTMALVARRWNLMEPLRAFAQSGRPVWGTCAGLIFLAGAAINVKQGGQELVGGLDVEVARNFFGAQINSFETHLPAPAAIRGIKDAMPADQPADTFRAVFIRAPAVTKVGPDVDVLAEYSLTADERAEDASRPEKVIVAVRQGSLMATAFHPEVTNDGRWHAMFADMVSASCAKLGRAALKAKALSNGVELVKPKDVPKPLPVIE